MQLPLRYRFLLFLTGIRNWIVAQLISLALWIIRLIPLNYAAKKFESRGTVIRSTQFSLPLKPTEKTEVPF